MVLRCKYMFHFISVPDFNHFLYARILNKTLIKTRKLRTQLIFQFLYPHLIEITFQLF